MSRTLALAAALLGLLALAPSAHADLTMTRTAEAVVVGGDDGPNRIFLQDGNPSLDSVFSFYTDPVEAVDVGDSGCINEGGAPFQIIRCPTGSPGIAVFVLNGGNDRVEWYGDAVFDTMAGLGIDFGPGSDSNESGIKGIETFIDGGADADDLAGHDGPSSEVEGGPGNDDIVGGGGSTGEILRGGDGDDAIQGLNGADQIFGDAGGDTLIGGSGGDTITGGTGQDNVEGDGVPNAFSGNDTLILDDGERDAGVCGFGADSARVDALDLLPLNDCEAVTRPGLPGSGTPGSGTIPQRGSAKVALAKAKKLSARKRKLAVKVTCPRSASGSCSGRVAFTLRFTERRKKRTVRAGSTSFILSPGASRTVSRTLSKKLVRRLRKAKKRKLTVRATSRDNAGRSFTSTRTGALKLTR
jgi:hypothetical protein